MTIGIGYCIPNRKPGINWSSYWATLISATVENAAPTNIVLTFPTAQSSLGASDFTIAGFTISSASWTGSVLTLVLSYGVSFYEGNLTITFVRTGTTAIVTNNVSGTGIIGWWAYDDLSTITKDGSNLVSQWSDKLASGRNFVQVDDGLKPTYTTSGIVSVDKKMTTAVTNGTSIRTLYMLFKLHSGMGFTKCALRTSNNSMSIVVSQNGTLAVYDGAELSGIAPVDTFFILKVRLLQGGNSWIQINDESRIIGNLGSNSTVNTLDLGFNAVNTSDITIKEIIATSIDDSDTIVNAVNEYLKKK